MLLDELRDLPQGKRQALKAEHLGYFAAEGLQVSFVEGGPEVDFITPVVNGAAQFGVAHPADALEEALVGLLHHDEVQVAPLMGVAAGEGAEDDDAQRVRLGELQDASDDRVEEADVDHHTEVDDREE